MAIPEKVKKAADRVRAAIYGGEVQESIAKGLEGAGEIADEANGTSKKVETDFKALQQEYTENGNGAQTTVEIISARDGEAVLADRLSRDFVNINEQLAETTAEINVARDGEPVLAERLKRDFGNVNAQLEQKASNQELQTERARIDSFTQLPDGSTTGDAELIDIRAGINSVKYQNAGTAVRDQLSSLDNYLRKNTRNILNSSLLLYDLQLRYLDKSSTVFDATSPYKGRIVTKPLNVAAGQKYKAITKSGKPKNISEVVFYSSDGSLLSYLSEVSQYEIPQNATQKRLQFANKENLVDMLTLVSDFSELIEYEPPYENNFLRVDEKETILKVSENKASELIDDTIYKRTNNVFDRDTMIINDKALVTWGNPDIENALFDKVGGAVVPEIVVNSGEVYKIINSNGTLKKATAIVFFDTLGNWVSQMESVDTFTVPSNATLVMFDFANKDNIPAGIMKVTNVYDSVTYQPYKLNRFKLEVQPEDEKPLDVIDKTGGYTAIFHSIGSIGDSLSSGAVEENNVNASSPIAIDNYDYSYGQSIARATGAKVLNFSQGGMTTKWWLESWLPEAVKTDNLCQAYIIMLGVNDRSSIPLGNLGDIDLDNPNNNAESFYGYYGKIIQKLKEVQPKAKFFLVAQPYPEQEEYANKAVRELVNIFDNCYLIDLAEYAMLEYDVQTNYKHITHYTTVGYQRLSWQIMSYIDYIVRHNLEDFEVVQFIGTDYDYTR